MRIAVLFYGRIDKAKDTYRNITDAIGPENMVDYFLSTGEQSTEVLNTFIELYNPVAYTNKEIQFAYDIPSNTVNHLLGCRQHNTICSFINKQRAFGLLEAHMEVSSIDYDIILSLRCDILFKQKIQYLVVKEDTLYLPISYSGFTLTDYMHRIPGFTQPLKGITDTIAYGKVSAMRKYSNIIDNMMYLLNTGNCAMHPEMITYANIMYNNLEIERFHTDFDIYR